MKRILALFAGVLLLAGCISNRGGANGSDDPRESGTDSTGGRTGSSPAGGSLGNGGGSSGMMGTGVGAQGSVAP
jgi:hypothetical protein